MLALESYSAASRIPVELIDKIVKNAKTNDLKSFSLISLRWADPCQRYLFKAMNVDPGEYHPIYDQGEHLWQHIRSLTFIAGRGPVRKPVGRVHANFPVFLHGLSRIGSLCIHRLRWSVLSTAALEGLLEILSKPSFERLTIFPNDSWEGFPLILLRYCPSVKTLTFHHPEPCGREVVPSFRYPPGPPMDLPEKRPLRLRDLTLEGGRTIDLFLCLLGGQEGEEEGEEEEHEEGEEGEEKDERGEEEGEERMVVDKEWCGLAQLDQLSRLCLSYTDVELDEGNNVDGLLRRCGAPVVDLTLRFERLGDETEMGYGISPDATETLVRLRRLTMLYSCPTAELFTLAAAKEWFFQFLQDLPSPKRLEKLDISWVIYHESSRKHVERHMLRRFDNFMEILGKLIRERLTGLRYLKFETRTVWDCPEPGEEIRYPRQDLPEFKQLVKRLRSSLKGVRVKVILA